MFSRTSFITFSEAVSLLWCWRYDDWSSGYNELIVVTKEVTKVVAKFVSKSSLAYKFSDFFVQKIDTIQTKLNNMVSNPSSALPMSAFVMYCLLRIDILSQSDV